MTLPPGRLDAVVVNYESGPLLARCVASLAAAGVGTVVVVDNGSSDGSVAALAGAPGVEVVTPERNVGYGAATNRGVALTSAPSVLVCNPDLEVPDGGLDALVAALERDRELGVVGPTVLGSDGERYPSARRFPSLVDSAGHALIGLVRPDNRFTRRYHGVSAREAEAQPEGAVVPVDWISGSAMVFRREAFEAVGGFDEAFFMYAEDVDVCWRLGRAGWKVGWVPGGAVVHVQGASTARHPYRMIAAHHRSLLRFAAKRASGAGRLALPFVAVGLGVRMALASLRAWEEGRRGGGSVGPRARR